MKINALGSNGTNCTESKPVCDKKLDPMQMKVCMDQMETTVRKQKLVAPAETDWVQT